MCDMNMSCLHAITGRLPSYFLKQIFGYYSELAGFNIAAFFFSLFL